MPGRRRSRRDHEPAEPRHFTVVKTWYQDDYGLFARFDSLLCKALAAHPRIDRVVHLAPPLPPHELRRRGKDGYWEANLDRLTARASGDGYDDDGVWLYTAPCGETLHEAAAVRCAEVVRGQAVEGSWLVVVEMLTAHPFARYVVQSLPDAIRVAVLEDDHRIGRHDAAELTTRFRQSFADSAFGMVSSPSLLEEYAEASSRISLIPRVTEPEVYASAAASAELADLARPIAVYAGWLRDRIDYDLLRQVIKECCEITFVLAGGGDEVADRELAGLPNVVAIGPRAGAMVPALLAAADVAIVPHLVDSLTEGMTPDKVIHYLASGRPIVSTPVAGVRTMPSGLVVLASSAEDFGAAVRAAVADPTRGAEARRAAVAGLTLEALAEWFVASLDAAADGAPVPLPPAIA